MDAIRRAGAGLCTAGTKVLSALLLSLVLLSAAAFAQQPPQAPDLPKPPPEATSPTGAGNSSDNSGQNRNDRIFSVVPNYMTVDEENNHQIPPLSAGAKFKLFVKSAFDPGAFIVTGILAGEQQGLDTYPEWGQGAAGYGRRYASGFADETIEGFTTTALFPVLFHQDPRYFRLGQGKFWHRTAYAISRIVVTRTDSAHNTFNSSEILGATVAGVSVAYHPAPERTWAGAGSTVGTDVAVDTLSNFFREFWPDIEHKLHWKQLPF
jgi:hypothetical protein